MTPREDAAPMLRGALPALLLVLPLALAPADASHAGSEPRLLLAQFEDDGWMSVRMTLSGSGVTAWLNSTGTGPEHQLATFVYGPGQVFAGGFGFGVFRGQARAVAQLDASAAGLPVVTIAQTAYSEPTSFSGMGFDVRGTGEAWLLVLSAGGGRWSLDMHGAASNAIVATDSGADAFLLTQDGFEQGSGAHVDALGPGARVDLARAHVRTVDDTLVAVYGPGAVPSTQVPPLAVGANDMRIGTPTGERLCVFACDFVQFVGEGERRGHPGDYAFHLTGAAAGLAEDVTLWGADARLAGAP